MTIVEAIKTDEINRISAHNRWMYWSEGDFEEQADCWIVRESQRRNSKIIAQTPDEEEAVKWLIGKEEE